MLESRLLRLSSCNAISLGIVRDDSVSKYQLQLHFIIRAVTDVGSLITLHKIRQTFYIIYLRTDKFRR